MKLIIDIPNNWEERIGRMSDSEIADYLYGICRSGVSVAHKEIITNIIQEKIKENEQRKVELLSDMMRMKTLNIYDQCRRGEQDETDN